MRSTLTATALALLSLTVIAVAQNQPVKFEVSTIKPYQQDRTANFEYSGGSCHGTDTQYPSVNRIPPPPLGRCVGDDPPRVRFGPGSKVTAQNVTMSYFANSIRGMAGGAVTDKTGLADKYDFSFEWEQGDPGGFLSGLQSELGLRIEPMKSQAEFIIIDHAEKPDAN